MFTVIMRMCHVWSLDFYYNW